MEKFKYFCTLKSAFQFILTDQRKNQYLALRMPPLFIDALLHCVCFIGKSKLPEVLLEQNPSLMFINDNIITVTISE